MCLWRGSFDCWFFMAGCGLRFMAVYWEGGEGANMDGPVVLHARPRSTVHSQSGQDHCHQTGAHVGMPVNALEQVMPQEVSSLWPGGSPRVSMLGALCSQGALTPVPSPCADMALPTLSF